MDRAAYCFVTNFENIFVFQSALSSIFPFSSITSVSPIIEASAHSIVQGLEIAMSITFVVTKRPDESPMNLRNPVRQAWAGLQGPETALSG
jgi:hypothetical protein